MSHRPNGSRTVACPFCSQRYERVNWMIRKGFRTDEGKLLPDAHQIACYRKRQQTLAGEKNFSEIISPTT